MPLNPKDAKISIAVLRVVNAEDLPKPQKLASPELKKEAIRYLELRRDEIVPLVPIAEVVIDPFYERSGGRKPSEVLRQQIHLLDGLIATPTKENLHHYLSFPELSWLSHDFGSLVASGKPTLPEDLAEIPRFLAEKKLQEERLRAQTQAKEKERVRATQREREEQAKAAKRAQLAKEYGINLETLAK